jgi:uncharacterized membrane protein YbaN (DUF454 family)
MKDSIKKGILVTSGTFFLILGFIGIFIPLLPTTPFLLLAAACYFRSSKRFYNWLIKNKWLGKYIKNYQEGRGIPLNIKIISILVLWLTIILSTFIIISNFIIQIFLFIIASGVTIHIMTIKTLNRNEE